MSVSSPLHRPLALWLAAWVCASAAQASSTASSAASDSASSTASSASDSFRGSSNASSPGGRQAAGEFRIVAVLAPAERPERAQLVLEPLAGNPSPAFTLELPRATLARESLAAGDVVAARPRPYGVEFARAADGGRGARGESWRAFFLVLDDVWFRELPARPVRL